MYTKRQINYHVSNLLRIGIVDPPSLVALIKPLSCLGWAGLGWSLLIEHDNKDQPIVQ